MGILGGIAKWLLNPIISWAMGLLYSLFIRGPLTLLSYTNQAFQYVSGSETDKLLFNTSMVNGKPELNFFTSDSPLKYFFLIMLGVAGALLAAFLGMVMIKSITGKRGQGPFNKFGKVIINSSIVFALPAMFLMILSLSGGVLSAINGGHVNISKQNISVFSSTTNRMLNDVRTAPSNMKDNFDSSFKIQGMKDTADKDVGVGNDTALSLSEIYTNLADHKKWKTTETMKALADQAQDMFQKIKTLLVQPDLQGGYKLNKDCKSQIIDVMGVISKLKPNMKDNPMSDRVKKLESNLQTVQDAINAWVQISQSIMGYEGQDQTQLPNRAIRNYRVAFRTIYGRKDDKDLEKITQVQTLQDLNQVIAYLINGSPGQSTSGLMTLRSSLSTIEDNPLVVAFYRTATGNKDSNWDRGVFNFHSNGFMLLMGFFLIMAAVVIMLLSILFAVGRIFDLALLFIISPIVVTTSVFDDGSRFKSWMNMVIAKLISIFGIVISLRLFGVINASFIKGMSHSSMFQGDSGFLMQQLLAAFFGIGGLLAAYKSSSTLSGIVGAGYGIMDGLQAGQTLGVLRSGSKMFMGAGKGIGKLAGIKSGNGGGSPGGSGSSVPSGPPRSRMGQVKDTWKNRGNKLNKASTKLSFGKVGTKSARTNYLQNKLDKSLSKQPNKEYKQNKRQNKKTNFKQVNKTWQNHKSDKRGK